MKYEKLEKRNVHFLHEMLAIKRDTGKLKSDLRTKPKNSIDL